MTHITRTCLAMMVLALLLSIPVTAVPQDHPVKPMMVMPHPVLPVSFEYTADITNELKSAGTLTVDVQPDPMPEFCSDMLGISATARLTLHAGGDDDVFRSGATTFSASVTGTLVGKKAVGEDVLATVTLNIDALHPEATFLYDNSGLVGHSAYITKVLGGGAPANLYTEIVFRIASGGFTESAPPAIENALRLELVYEHMVRAMAPSTLTLLTAPDRVANTFATLPGGATSAAAALITNSRVRLGWQADPEACENDLQYVSGWQIQIMRVFNVEPTDAYLTNPYKVRGPLDWNTALQLTTEASARYIDITLAEGEGVYVYRIRPVFADEAHTDQARQGYGTWSTHPPTTFYNTAEIDIYSSTYGDWTGTVPNGNISVFYHQSETTRNRAYERTAASEIDRPLVQQESTSFLDAAMVPRQSQSIAAEADVVIVAETFTDNEGRAVSGTLPAPLIAHRQMGFEARLNDMGPSGFPRPYGASDFDDDAKVYAPNTVGPLDLAGANRNDISWYYSDANTDLRIPSADGYLTSRTILNAEGRPSVSTMPGAVRRSGSAAAAQQRVMYGSVADVELTSVFGSEAPLAASVRKTVNISADGVSSVSYIDLGGNVIATCLVGGTEIDGSVTGNEIVADGSGTLRNLNGNTSAANAIKEKVNALDIVHELSGGVQRAPGTYVASKRIVVSAPTTLSVSYTIDPQAVTLDMACLDYCFTCDWNTVIRATRIDPAPLKRAPSQVLSPGAPGDPLFRSCTLTTLNASDTITLPEAGTWLVERMVSFNTPVSTSSGKTWKQEHEDKAVADVLPLSSIYTEAFGASASVDAQLAYYTSYRNSHSTVNIYDHEAEADCGVDLPAVIPCPVDVCTVVGGVDPRLEEYFLEQWLQSKGEGSAEADITAYKSSHDITMLFRKDKLDNTAPSAGNKIYPDPLPVGYTRGWNLFEAMVAEMMAETAGTPAVHVYTCEQIWKAWRAAVGLKIGGYVPDVLETFLDLVGRKPLGIYSGGTSATFYTPAASAYAFHAYELVHCGISPTCNTCVTTIGARTNLTPADTYKYWAAIGECYETDGNVAKERVKGQDMPDPTTDPNNLGSVDRVNGKMLDQCMATCSGRRQEYVAMLRVQYGTSLPESDLLCKADALVSECEAWCTSAFPLTANITPTQVTVDAATKRMYGVPRIANPVGGGCTLPYTLAALAPGKTMLQLMADYLTTWYNDQSRTVLVKTCFNSAAIMRTFLLNSGVVLASIPQCIKDAAALTSNATDCTFDPPATLRRFFVTVLPGKPGRFYTETDATANCSDCALVFDGPTDVVLGHSLPQTLNTFFNDMWGKKITSYGLSMKLDSGTTRTSPTDPVYYRSQHMDNPYNDNYMPQIQTRVNQFVTAVYAISKDINGGPAGQFPLWTTQMFPYAADYDILPHMTLYVEDPWLFGIVDTTRPATDSLWRGAWRYFGLMSLTFGHPGSAEGATTIAAGIYPSNAPNAVLGGITVLQDGFMSMYRTDYPATADNAELKVLSDTNFTATIGTFSIGPAGNLRFFDKRKQRMDDGIHISLYETKKRMLLGTDIGCDVSSLCVRQQCSVCVRYDIQTPETVDYARGRDRTPPSCASVEVERLKSEIAVAYAQRVRTTRQTVGDAYAERCLNMRYFSDRVSIGYQEKYYHYTLMYYDRAGRVQRTVPPRGVDMNSTRTRTTRPSHTMSTSYTYGSAGERRSETGPDVGATNYWYDGRGRLRFAQTAAQAAAGARVTYYVYDRLGRSTEMGELDVPSGTVAAFAVANLESDAYLATATTRRDITRTHYGSPASGSDWTAVTTEYPGIAQKRTRGKASWTESLPLLSAPTTDVVRTYYSYGPHGEMEWVVTDIPRDQSSSSARVLKKTDYTYDYTLGTVKKAEYQKGKADAFTHMNTVDGDGRIVDVYTSRDQVNWDRDAHYEYGIDGRHQRTVLGEDRVQGIDYTYTLDGAIKGINHPSLDVVQDPGGDASSGSVNEDIPADVFGLSVGYYNGDFARTSGGNLSPYNAGNDSLWAPLAPLYSGQIGSVSYRTLEITPGVPDVVRDGALLGERYVYDRIGRLRGSTSSIHTGSAFISDGTGGWATDFLYDPHGNQLSARRSALTDDVTSVVMDDIDVTLKSATSNVTGTVAEAGAGVAGYTSDLTAVTSGNSVYDASGRATTLTDANASSGMEWNAWHEDTRLTLNGHEPMKVLRDAAGNVVRYAPADGSGTYVYIARDPAGNEMARYTGAGSEAPGITEWPIYGISGRLGVSRDVSTYSTAPYYTRTVQTHFYELTDQVGSVRAVVADIRKDVANPTVPVLVAMADYDAYGIVRPKRSHTAAALTSYGYGFQGMASLGIIGSSEIYTTPFRLYDARKGSWLAADPIFHTGESAYLGMNANPLSWVDPMGLDGETAEVLDPPVGAFETSFEISAEGDWVISAPRKDDPARLDLTAADLTTGSRGMGNATDALSVRTPMEIARPAWMPRTPNMPSYEEYASMQPTLSAPNPNSRPLTDYERMMVKNNPNWTPPPPMSGLEKGLAAMNILLFFFSPYGASGSASRGLGTPGYRPLQPPLRPGTAPFRSLTALPVSSRAMRIPAVNAFPKLPNLNPIWTGTKNIVPSQNAVDHWNKHGHEFPEYSTPGQYVQGTHNFFANPPAGTLTKVRANGDMLFYNPATNTFGVQAVGGAPRTMFRPDPTKHGYPTNLDYFNAQ